jgi:hypothetical protein
MLAVFHYVRLAQSAHRYLPHKVWIHFATFSNQWTEIVHYVVPKIAVNFVNGNDALKWITTEVNKTS